jgi:cobalt-zinc-cadmium efflux system outer membrane protein
LILFEIEEVSMSHLFRINPTLWACLFIALPVAAQENSSPAPIAPPEISTESERSQESENVAEPEVSIDELIRLALENNPQPAIARANLEAARQRAGALKSLPNPVLQLVPGFIGDEEARDEEIILSQPLDLFGQRKAQRRVLEAESRRVAAESTLVTRSLVVEVKNSAANLFAAQEAESLGQAQVEVAEQFRAAAARRAELGDVPPVQAQRAELELLRVQNELTNARAERLVRRAVLNQLIGQAPETPLRVSLPLSPALADLLRARGAGSTLPATEGATTIPEVGPEAAPPTVIPGGAVLPPSPTPPLAASSQVGSVAIGNTIFAQRGALLSSLVNRPDIVGAEATLEARRAQVDAIGKQRLPQFELQARRSSFFGREGSYALRAVITAPVFDFGSIRGDKRAAQADVRAQEARISLLRSQAAAQVEQALIRLDQQRATVERYRTGIVPQTLDLLRKTQIGFAQGASSYLEVLEAQRTLRAVQTEYLQALVGVRTSEAQLESALGATPPEDLLSVISNPAGASTPPGVTAPGTVSPNLVPPVESPPLNPPSVELPATSTPATQNIIEGDR